LKKDGTVWGWGINTKGQLGNGTTARSTTAIQVPGVADVTDIDAGPNFVLALLKDGRVMAWGENNNGQLGLGDTVDPKTTPQEMQFQSEDPANPGQSTLYRVVLIRAGGAHSLIVKMPEPR
jgi:alpha-tubulin suppressor-like RCC1 family protein